MKCLLLSTDLMLSSQVTGAAGVAGVDAETIANPGRLLDRVGGLEGIYVVLIDLSLPRLDVASVVDELRGMPCGPSRVLAVGPHVHEQKLAAATRAGCDPVLTRGQARRDLAALLAQFAEEASS